MPYNYAVNGTDIEQYCDMVRIFPEQLPGMRGPNVVLPFQDGELDVLNRPFGSYDLILETLVSMTPSWYDNKISLAKLLMNPFQTIWLQRDIPTDPTDTQVEIPIRVLQPIPTGSPRMLLRWLCRTLDPFWRDRTQTTGDTSPVSIANGDAPISDAVLNLTAGTNVRCTHSESGDWVDITGAATGVVIDMGARTVTDGGGDRRADFEAKNPWWIRLRPGTNTFTFTGGGAGNFDYYEKYL